MHVFKHPKFYEQYRKRAKQYQREEKERESHKQQASSYKRQAVKNNCTKLEHVLKIDSTERYKNENK